MANIRVRSLSWNSLSSGELQAQSALGRFTVTRSSKTGFFYAELNESAFPVLFDNLSNAKLAAQLHAHLEGFPAGIPFTWLENDQSGESVSIGVRTLHVLPSHSIDGYFIMDDEAPVRIQLADVEQAKEACQQYLIFVWFTLSEIY